MGLLRIPRQDDQESYVLVRVDPLTHKAATALDVKILATEGSAPFVLSLKQSQALKLKSKKAPCSDDEWEAILEAILLQQESDPSKSAVLEGIEVEAAIEEEVAVEIIFKKSTSGITQRLGSIRLLHDEDQEIELFDWCGGSIQYSHSLVDSVKAARLELEKEQAKSQKLFDELEELIKAKAEHENELLEKFSKLLNEKKAKIRDQQRALNRSGADTESVEMASRPREEVASPPPAASKKAGPSRRGKRKAATPEPEEMDINDDPVKGEEDDEDTRNTSDEETTENDDVEDEGPAVAAKKAVQSRADAMDQDGSATESEDDGL